MRYLKGYNLYKLIELSLQFSIFPKDSPRYLEIHDEYVKMFESNIIDLSKVKEAFYSISDRYKVEVSEFKDTINRRENDAIKVSIYSVDYNAGPEKDIDYDSIKDDLDFAINYVVNELKFNLRMCYAYDRRWCTHNLYINQLKLNIKKFRIPQIDVYFDVPKMM